MSRETVDVNVPQRRTLTPRATRVPPYLRRVPWRRESHSVCAYDLHMDHVTRRAPSTREWKKHQSEERTMRITNE